MSAKYDMREGLIRRLCHLLLAVCIACSADAGESGSDQSRAEPVRAELIASVGQVEGQQEYLLGDVTAVALGPGDILYVADRLGSTVRAYDLEGRFLLTVGTEGDGPGEFQWPNDLTFDPAGRLYVRDANRITVLESRQPTSPADSVVRTVPLGGYANLNSTRARTDGQIYYYPHYLFRRDEPPRFLYLIFDSTGATGDTVSVPQIPNLESGRTAFYMVSAGSGRMVDGLNRAPFEPTASWDIAPSGRLFTSPGDRYEITQWSSEGDTIARIELAGPPRAVPEAEHRDSANAFQSRLDSVPVPLDQVQGMSDRARSGSLPATLPEVLAIHVGADANLWVRRWPPEANATAFDVLNEEGGFRNRVHVAVSLLMDPPPFVSARYIVGVVRDPVTEVERVVVFRTNMPA